MAKLTKDEINQLGWLSRIKILPGDMDTLMDELSGIFTWIEALDKVDVTGIPSFTDQDHPTHERADETQPTPGAQLVTQNAPESLHDMFSVPKVVE